LLADLVVVVHLGFVVFVVVGGLGVLRRPRLVWLHLPAAMWGAWVELSASMCPLTPLENRFRRLGGQSGYGGGFIEHYLIPILYPAGLTRAVQVWLGVGVIALNVAVYVVVLRRRARRTRDSEVD